MSFSVERFAAVLVLLSWCVARAGKCYSALLRTCSLLRDDNGAVVEPDVRRDGRALCASGAALRQRQNVGGLRILAEHVPALEPRTNSI